MFTLVRRIHLYASVVLMTFVLMYFATGYIVIHRDWFHNEKPKPQTTTQMLSLASGDLSVTHPDDAADVVQRALGLPGQRRNARPPTKPGGPWQFTYVTTRVAYQVSVSLPSATSQPSTQPAEAASKATIVQTPFTATETINAFHRLRSGGGVRYNVWGVFFDASAIALIVFAMSGIYLWFKLAKVRWPGALVLLLSLGFTIGVYVYLAVAP